MTSKRRGSGVTFVEVLMVLVILGILLAVAAPSLADMLNRRRVQAIAEQISTDLAFARAETALRPLNAVRLIFRNGSDQSCYTVSYFDTSPRCNCLNTGDACMSATTEFKTERIPKSVGVSFASSAPTGSTAPSGTVSFETPQLTASPQGFSVTVSGVRGAQLKLELNAAGRVRTCTPNGSFSGVPPC
ncbi:pilus assembly FimT family protein [Roseateles violae]|uniref:Prepilin-type N-terminal cleavage/methylation domain-containing protein n=1 Tax=Roseateles violae TaxID=3058042 RepID=A0ABT8DQC7_9BURK|nr:prepilin-type N-terminal cleavage/methylation domain-containing protein [Pelomonas sp. PFR6]MDN3920559.1 prepilin-type N-terminal cleavage/methylation domain-containing protein [Pelomonas sp. PFR6]